MSEEWEFIIWLITSLRDNDSGERSRGYGPSCLKQVEMTRVITPDNICVSPSLVYQDRQSTH